MGYMEQENIQSVSSPLETEPIGKLIFKYSIPAVISSLVGSIYNIVDQIFIGNSVGKLGNAATNVAVPLVMIIVTLAMMFGVGGASAFSLYLGAKDERKAKSVVGTAISMLILSGAAIGIVSFVFIESILTVFGGRGQTLEYAIEYTRIVALGAPFAMLETGGSQLIRADGSPRYAMLSNMSGAVLNCILDPIFIFGLNMGMTGAALATVIGQFVGGVLILFYFSRFKSFKLTLRGFIPNRQALRRICSLGMAAGANQLAVTAVQIVMNNTLGHYGELSQYGRDIPLACVGVITKVSSVFSGVMFGIAQSTQPIIGYNYGAKNTERVKATFKRAAIIILCISTAAFLCFQIFPRQIIRIFGSGDELYYEFGERYFHIFLFCIIIAGLQILCAQFFPSIGKGGAGTVVSLSRQVFFLLPLVVIFPMIWGIDGVLWAGPIADGASGIMGLLLVRREMKKWQ